MALRILLNFALIDWSLVSNIVLVELGLAENDLEHGHDSREFEMVKSLLKWLVLINNCDVADFIVLVEALDTVLNEFGKFNRAFDGVRHALNCDRFLAVLSVGEQFVSTLEVAADSDAALDSDLVGRQDLLCLVDSLVFVCHCGSVCWF